MQALSIKQILEECRAQIFLCLPVLLAQVAMVSMGVVDIVMTGRVGPLDMAAVSLASSLWLPTIVFGQGVIIAAIPRISYFLGSRELHLIGHTMRQAFWLNLLVIVVLMSIMYILSYNLLLLGFDESLSQLTGEYLRAIIWGGPAYFIFVTIRACLEGHARTRPAMFAGFVGLAINIPCNYVLIFGKLGFPAMGAVGAGIATAITYVGMMLMLGLIALSMKDIREKLLVFEWPAWQECKILFKVGLPSAFASLCEVSMFAFVAILLAPFGAVVIAGHQAALSFTALAFMLPFSIAMSATVRVSYFHGIASKMGVICATRSSQILGFIVTIFLVVVSLLFRHEIAELYTNNKEVAETMAMLLFYAALYQVTDVYQIICSGVLRGYNDTRVLFIISFIVFWLVGIPAGFVLGRSGLFPALLGPKGFWIAFILGVSLAAVIYTFRIIRLERKL